MSEWDVETLQKISREAAKKIGEGKRVVIQISSVDGRFLLGCKVGDQYKDYLSGDRYCDSLDDILEMIKGA